MRDQKITYLERFILIAAILALAIIFGAVAHGKYESKQIKFSTYYQSYYWAGGPRCNSEQQHIATHCRDTVIKRGGNHAW